MKKIINYLLLAIVAMLPFVVNAKENVSITSVVLKSKSDTMEELSSPTTKDLTMGFDVKFNKFNDYIEYQVTVENKDSVEYQLSTDSNFKSNEYIDYKLTYDGGSVVKGKSKKTFTVKASYSKGEVPDSKFTGGVFSDQNQMRLSLSTASNPETASNPVVISLIILLILAGVTLIVFRYNKTAKVLVITLLVLVPLTTFAVTKLTITMDAKIKITQTKEFCLLGGLKDDSNTKTYHTYIPNMTWEEYKESIYADIPDVWTHFPHPLYTKANLEIKEFPFVQSNNCTYSANSTAVPDCIYSIAVLNVSMDDKINDKTHSCYKISEKKPASELQTNDVESNVESQD